VLPQPLDFAFSITPIIYFELEHQRFGDTGHLHESSKMRAIW